MHRRTFLQCAAAAPWAAQLSAAEVEHKIPKYRVVSKYAAAAQPGMPGPFPGRVVSVHAARCIEDGGTKPDPDVVREMVAQGMRALTGDQNPRDAWARFIAPSDVVGIKVNCSGAPGLVSSPVVVAEIVRNVMDLGLKPDAIWVYERFEDQIKMVRYDRWLPAGVNIWTAETFRGSSQAYDPATYVETTFFDEDDTRSNMARMVSGRFTKIINVPMVKDHGASGVTGCLKNIAYGSFSNVARSHSGTVTNTYSFIGTLAAVEPLRSRTVLQIMDGMRGVWHGGPFLLDKKFVFYPKRLLFGTDPVAMDRLLIDIVDEKRKAEHAASVWDRSMKYVNPGGDHAHDPNVFAFVRETGHIEYAAHLGLGVYDLDRIKIASLEV